MIRLENLKKAYQQTVVLDVDHFEVKPGDTIGLVGNNGAGKTTMLSLILDLIRPTQGEVFIKDQNVRISEEWKQYTTAFLDESFLINFLTPDEYFEFVGSLYSWSPTRVKEYILKYAEFFNDEIIGKKKYIRDLSKGNQKKVGLIGAFIGDPEIIVLDEPFSNLDPTSQIRLKRIIDEINDEKTMLISSHDLNHITDICRRIVLLDKGVIAKDTMKGSATLQELEAYFAA